jgi:hypothetical protein
MYSRVLGNIKILVMEEKKNTCSGALSPAGGGKLSIGMSMDGSDFRT